MNFHIKTPAGFAPGVMPLARLEDGWREGEELFVNTPEGWRTVWRRTVVFINEIDRAGATIFDLMGQPTKARNYVFINRAVLYGVAGGFALRTGVFPAGSTLTIINENYIRGPGGRGGSHSLGMAGVPGGAALLLDFPTRIDNAAGWIWGGGGGGGGFYADSRNAGGGGGAGRVPGSAGGSFQSTTLPYVSATSGTETTGGAGARFPGYGPTGAAGGLPGSPGNTGTYAAGAAGRAIQTNSHALTWLAGNTTDQVKGPIE